MSRIDNCLSIYKLDYLPGTIVAACAITAIALLILGGMYADSKGLVMMAGGLAAGILSLALLKGFKDPEWIPIPRNTNLLQREATENFGKGGYTSLEYDIEFLSVAGKYMDSSRNYYYNVARDTIYVKRKSPQFYQHFR